MVKVRNETEKDYKIVEEITRKVLFIICMFRAVLNITWFILCARTKTFCLSWTLLLNLTDRLSEILCIQKAELVDENGEKKEILTFGPVSILPEYQRMGYGKILMEHSFERAFELGYDVIVIFGNPGNYVSRGFKSCKKYNVCLEDGTFPSAMLVKELKPGALDGRKWIYHDSEVMQLDEKEAQLFDDGLEKNGEEVSAKPGRILYSQPFFL